MESRYTLGEFLKDKGVNSLTRAQATFFGVPYPLTKGWPKRFKENSVTEEVYKLALDSIGKNSRKVSNKLRRSRKGEIESVQVVYVITDNLGNSKIGITCDIVSRLSSLSSGTANILEVRRLYTVGNKLAKQMEKHLHSLFCNKRIKGEWFSLSKEDIKTIDDYMYSNGCGVSIKGSNETLV